MLKQPSYIYIYNRLLFGDVLNNKILNEVNSAKKFGHSHQSVDHKILHCE